MPSIDLFRAELDVFSGPLDLLLYLVRRQELDAADLPVARIARQFEELTRAVELIDVDAAAEFLVTAATLTEIKSRDVLPRAEAEETPGGDADPEEPDGDLVARLLEYKRYKDASLVLAGRAEAWSERYERVQSAAPAGGREASLDRIRDVELWDLLSAFARVVRTQLEEEEKTVRVKELPVHELVEQVGGRIRAQGEVRFFDLFEGQRRRSPIVGLFLAVLELVRHHGFRAEQPEVFGDITLRPPADSPE